MAMLDPLTGEDILGPRGDGNWAMPSAQQVWEGLGGGAGGPNYGQPPPPAGAVPGYMSGSAPMWSNPAAAQFGGAGDIRRRMMGGMMGMGGFNSIGVPPQQSPPMGMPTAMGQGFGGMGFPQMGASGPHMGGGFQPPGKMMGGGPWGILARMMANRNMGGGKMQGGINPQMIASILQSLGSRGMGGQQLMPGGYAGARMPAQPPVQQMIPRGMMNPFGGG